MRRRRTTRWRLACRTLSLAALAAAGGAVGGVALGPPAAAVAPSKVAYWIKGGVPLPTVPKGGLLVANDPTSVGLPTAPPLPVPLPVPVPTVPRALPTVIGPTAVSAVIIDGATPDADATLTLLVGLGSLAPLPGTTTLVACPIQVSWTPPAGGAGELGKAPAADCSSTSIGRVAGDMKSISWLLPASFQTSPGTFNVELAPDPAGKPVPFIVPFLAPGAGALLSAAGPPSPPAAPAAPAPAGQATVPVADVALPLYVPSPDTQAAAPQARALPSVGGRSAGAVTTGARLPLLGDDRGHRIMAVAVLFMVAAAWWWIGSRPVRLPRLLGALGADGAAPAGRRPASHTGGIGRFARVRHLEARRL
jgi:hypothetical protein